MAAQQNPQLPEVVEIRQLAAVELENLLQEEGVRDTVLGSEE